MAKEEKNSSPFSALSFQEQQERWLAWRSQHLTFEPLDSHLTNDAAPVSVSESENRNVGKPVSKNAESKSEVSSNQGNPASQGPAIRHGELDRLNARHQSAAKNAVNWYHT